MAGQTASEPTEKKTERKRRFCYRYGKKASVVVMGLGYPSTKQLSRWVRIYEEKGYLPKSQENAIHVRRKLLLMSIILLTAVACRTLVEPSATPVTKF